MHIIIESGFRLGNPHPRVGDAGSRGTAPRVNASLSEFATAGESGHSPSRQRFAFGVCMMDCGEDLGGGGKLEWGVKRGGASTDVDAPPGWGSVALGQTMGVFLFL